MKLQDFDYHLPQNLIAQYPLKRRDQARLLVLNRDKQTITHDRFANLEKYLPTESMIVLNDSKVICARLLGRKQRTGGQVEIFLLNQLADKYSYHALLRPVRRLKYHDQIQFDGNGLIAEIIDKNTVRFNQKNLTKALNRIGHMPLPPYIKRADEPIDRRYYQTVYANKEGSVAAPTAGLHFTQRLITRLMNQGHPFQKVTLHINYATFKPVEETDITKHKMHTERYHMTQETFKRIKRHKKEGKKILAVGTTSCRVLETVADTGQLQGNTDLFVYPGYRFHFVDILLTNFHLPLSTLLMLVSAFAGHALMKRAYQEAIRNQYRFFSYGDAMLVL
ncbi:MAG: tRNA preQ1(34) S-adenosylmethionine ribosyltransferase-isomerase QueA [Candidatus Omnitrophota bacterium]